MLIFKSKCLIMSVCFVVLFISAVLGETVHFTNSQTQLERSLNTNYGQGLKTYQLEVPGSSSITIIEAEPWKPDTSRTGKSLSRDNFSQDYTDRRTKDYIVPGSTHENEESPKNYQNKHSMCFGPSCDVFDINKKTVYSPDLLSKFLKEYAEKIKNADQKIKDRLKEIEISSHKTHEGIVQGDKVYGKKKITDEINIKVHPSDNRRYSSWDEMDAKRQKHPYEDTKGWVALEAVPWTRSKISKWQANAYKVSKPQNNFNSYGNDRDPSQFADRFSNNYGKPEEENKPSGSFYTFPKPSSSSRPTYDSFQNNDEDWPVETPSRPAWEKPTLNRPYQYESDMGQSPQRPDCDHDHHQSVPNNYNRRVSGQFYENGGIITDGKPGDFPTTEYNYKKKDMHRPTDVYAEDQRSVHPASYPANGNGEWVLLSTTKGYKIPKNRQRSLSITPNSVLTSHRSVRLTVLPAINGSKENMTLSHGGMLEVDPSFQSVEESRKQFEKLQKKNSSLVKNQKIRRVYATNATPDSSAVMAAVGAGLVPATVAMIMPMVLGRKKRSLINSYYQIPANYPNVTQHPDFDFESTLQRSL